MTVSIITMHNYPNYGSVLQAFATQEKLKEFADNVEIIDYSGGDKTVGRSLGAYIFKEFHTNAHGDRPNPIKALLQLPIRLRRRAVFHGFAKRYLNLTTNRYSNTDDFLKFPFHDGLYCTGSDQVWNVLPENMPFFLDFVPEKMRKFSYSTSFGNKREDRLSPEEIEKIKKYIFQYAHISVREERALDFIQDQLGYQNAIQLIDPTLAVPPELWRKLAFKPRIKGDYILLYKLGKEKAFETLAENISKKTGLPLVRFCSQSLAQALRGKGRKYILPPVPQIITLIDNAQYVITDSFHGTALAMSLNTPPIVYREEYDGQRISGLLSLLGQEHRYVKSCDAINIVDRPVDFGHVNGVLEKERKRVDAFLNMVFNEEVLI